MLLGLGTALHVPVPGLPPARFGSGTAAVSASRGPTQPRLRRHKVRPRRPRAPRKSRSATWSMPSPKPTAHRTSRPWRRSSPTKPMSSIRRARAPVASRPSSRCMHRPSRKTRGLNLEPKVQEIRFLTPDVARVEGQTRLSTHTGDATEFTRFSSLLVKRDGKWLVAEIREYPAPVEDVSQLRTAQGARVDGRRLGRRERERQSPARPCAGLTTTAS